MSDGDLYVSDEYSNGYDHGIPTRVEVREGFGKHQLAIIDYPIPVSDYVNLAPGGTPMTLTWGTSPVDGRTFNGYVNHHEYWDDINNEQRHLRFYCTGTSKPLNDPNPGSWKNVTASYVAREVAQRHSLRCVLHQPDFTLPYWTPGQDSDFVMLNRLAQAVGYRFWVDGATLYFLDPRVELTALRRDVPTYEMDQSRQDTLLRVQAISGPLAPVAGAPVNQRIFGIDSSSNRFFQASSSRQVADLGLPTPDQTSVLAKDVASLEEAQRLNETAAVEGVWTHIQAITVGDSRARVGGMVTLAGEALNQTYQGDWTASDIAHIISSNPNNGITTYRTQIELIRNQQDGNFYTGSGFVKAAIKDVPAVLRGGKYWESSILEWVYV